MDNLRIEETIKTPGVEFNAGTGVLKISGRAIPENPEVFFADIMDWVFTYFKNPQENTEVEIQLEYINSGASKFILEFFHLLEEKFAEGHPTKVLWYYEEDDESVYELGKHYQSILKVPFQLKILY
jgi:hypothetical protein